MSETVVAALYKFVTINELEPLRSSILSECKRQNIKGTLLLAHEGINGTIAGSRQGIDSLISFLTKDVHFDGLEIKESFTEENPFYRMKVKLKREIVTLGVDGTDPNCQVGAYVEPQDWNKLIADPEVLLIDTRNDYEVAIGSFEGAVDPQTTNFREFPEYVQARVDKNRHKKVAMFCTGGIRCEKASAYMLNQGFEQVYHLKGGILKYLEEIPEQDSMWRGECFVFDNRVAVNHQLEVGSYDMCHACRHPISEAEKSSDKYVEGVSCVYCFDQKSDEDRQRYAQRQHQIRLSRNENRPHIGLSKEDILQARLAKSRAAELANQKSVEGQKRKANQG